MNPIRKWKKFLAVGCSHGDMIDPSARAAVLQFQKQWKPDTTIHLGDALDMTAFRAGAKGTSDEAAPIPPDLDAGVSFIRDLKPNVYLMGNHEDRLWKLRNHPNAIVSMLSTTIVGRIQDECSKLKCKIIPYGFKSYYELGDWKFFHGWFFNEQAARDHAEAFGNCIFAHTHRAAYAKARNNQNSTGICVGTLMDIARAEYAKNRRATMGWSQGFAWGEYSDDRAVAWLHEQPQGLQQWHLPN